MEGLLPLVFKTIQRKKTRRSYECLAVSPAQGFQLPPSPRKYLPPPAPAAERDHKVGGGFQQDHPGGDHYRHRRSMSVGYHGGGGNFSPERYAEERSPRLARGRSLRPFACLTGA